jgi:hypothetical protein
VPRNSSGMLQESNWGARRYSEPSEGAEGCNRRILAGKREVWTTAVPLYVQRYRYSFVTSGPLLIGLAGLSDHPEEVLGLAGQSSE